MANTARKSHIIPIDRLPPDFPTHKHPSYFWEQLGRCVASFGFLEETLGKAIFSFTGTREVNQVDWEAEYIGWLKQLERALSDELGRLITNYEKSVRDHQEEEPDGFANLISDLKHVKAIRNVICHGSWRVPDDDGFSLPLFTNRSGEVWNIPIDVKYLISLQISVAHLTAAVINTVTSLGWQFPGSTGPGKPIWSGD